MDGRGAAERGSLPKSSSDIDALAVDAASSEARLDSLEARLRLLETEFRERIWHQQSQAGRVQFAETRNRETGDTCHEIDVDREAAARAAARNSQSFTNVPHGNAAPTALPGLTCDDFAVTEFDASVGIQSMTSDGIEALMGDKSTRRIAPSVWECAVFIGLPGMGAAGSFMLLLSVLINVMLQLVFCLIASHAFTGDTLPDPAEARQWRLISGHDYYNMDSDNWVSLVERVCGNDNSLIVSGRQLDILEQIREYLESLPMLGDNAAGKICIGEMLCAVTVAVWLFIVAVEIQNTMNYGFSIWVLPRGNSVRITMQGDRLKLEGMAKRRLLIVAISTFAHMAIIGIIAYVGALWLAMTTEPMELVLNAAALAFVLNIDELVFETITPLTMRTITRQLLPLKKPVGVRWRGLGVFPVLMFCLCLFGTIFFVLNHAMPLKNKMAEIELQMCGRGRKNFVVTQNLQFGMAYISDTNKLSAAGVKENTLLQHVTDHFIDYVKERNENDTETDNTPRQSQLKGIWYPADEQKEFVENLALKREELDDTWPCHDENPVAFGVPKKDGIRNAFWTGLHFNYDRSAQNCTELRAFCPLEASATLRFACARTCGCASPLSMWPRRGCPPRCSVMRKEISRQYDCDDHSNETWKYHWDISLRDQLFIFSQRIEAQFGADFPQVTTAWAFSLFQEHGCEAIELIRANESSPGEPVGIADYFCSPPNRGQDTPGLNAFCAKSCRCVDMFREEKNHRTRDCPPGCVKAARGGCPPYCPPFGTLPTKLGCSAGMCLAGTFLGHVEIVKPGIGGSKSMTCVEIELEMFRQTDTPEKRVWCHSQRIFYSKDCCANAENAPSLRNTKVFSFR